MSLRCWQAKKVKLPFEVAVFATVPEHVPKQQRWGQKQTDELCCTHWTALRQQHCHLHFSAADQPGLALLLGLRLSGFPAVMLSAAELEGEFAKDGQ